MLIPPEQIQAAMCLKERMPLTLRPLRANSCTVRSQSCPSRTPQLLNHKRELASSVMNNATWLVRGLSDMRFGHRYDEQAHGLLRNSRTCRAQLLLQLNYNLGRIVPLAASRNSTAGRVSLFREPPP